MVQRGARFTRFAQFLRAGRRATGWLGYNLPLCFSGGKYSAFLRLSMPKLMSAAFPVPQLPAGSSLGFAALPYCSTSLLLW